MQPPTTKQPSPPRPGSITTRSLFSGCSSPVVSMCWRSRARPVAASRQVYAEPGVEEKERLEPLTHTWGEESTARAAVGGAVSFCPVAAGWDVDEGWEAQQWAAECPLPGGQRNGAGGTAAAGLRVPEMDVAAPSAPRAVNGNAEIGRAHV